MKGFQFYAEMPEARKSKSANKSFPHNPFTRKQLEKIADSGGRNNCLAVSTENVNGRSWRHYPEGPSSVIDCNPYCINWNSYSLDYLKTRCVRISEELARKLHPELFAYLESD